MTVQHRPDTSIPELPTRSRGPLARGWLRRTLLVTAMVWAAAVVLPSALGLSSAWRAFGAGLVFPGAGILYAIPGGHHHDGAAHLAGHVAVIAVLAVAALTALRRSKASVVMGGLLVAVLLAVGAAKAPLAVVVVAHVLAFFAVLVLCGWAYALRLFPAADYVTLPAVIVGSAASGAVLAAGEGGAAGPLHWVPWAALGLSGALLLAMLVRSEVVHRAGMVLGAERTRHLRGLVESRGGAQADLVPLQHDGSAPVVTEASEDELQLMRYLMSIAMQPPDEWDGYDRELSGPVAKYRYQVNALGWALSTFGYSHVPAFGGALLESQANLIERLQDKRVWGYWYWQNLLGNYDFVQRRADPVDVPQNIMFTGYLNLQLAMFRQATGDDRYDRDGSIVFDWSEKQRFTFNHQRINEVAIRNFGEDLCLWPCEPMPLGRRKHGFVFPYCNAVTLGGINVTDQLRGTSVASTIAPRLERSLQDEFTTSTGDVRGFVASGAGFTMQAVLSGPTTTASLVGFLAPSNPDLAWRSWEVLRHDWLDSGKYRIESTSGGENPDWGSGAKSNANGLAAAMFLARECGEQDWHDELWRAAREQLRFEEVAPGVRKFDGGSVHANGLLAFGAFGRGRVLTDMTTKGRPEAWASGPRLAEVPHPDVLVAKAVTDGSALDIVLYPGTGGGRFTAVVDRLRPGMSYSVAGGGLEAEVRADEAGRATISVDLGARLVVAVRPTGS